MAMRRPRSALAVLGAHSEWNAEVDGARDRQFREGTSRFLADFEAAVGQRVEEGLSVVNPLRSMSLGQRLDARFRVRLGSLEFRLELGEGPFSPLF